MNTEHQNSVLSNQDAIPDDMAFSADDQTFADGVRISLVDSDAAVRSAPWETDDSFADDRHETQPAQSKNEQEKLPINTRLRQMFVGMLATAVSFTTIYVEAKPQFDVEQEASAVMSELPFMRDVIDTALSVDTSDTLDVSMEAKIEQQEYTWMPESVMEHKPRLYAAAEQAGLPEDYHSLLLAIVRAESNGDVHAISPDPDNAQGLGQIMKHIEVSLREKYGLPEGSMFDPDLNALYTATLVNEIYNRVVREADAELTREQIVTRVAAGYNGGIKAERGIVQFDETNLYAWRVRGMDSDRLSPTSPTLDVWTPETPGPAFF